ncbi:hypothetical protein ACFZAM_31880 [Streptomyces sp. NPDC008079]|uniref:hypothetical protein n=1 Tax=Streptomyces sp. NPDC008079 TaxID=3364806 RepID=UPI0036EF509D
MTEQTPAAADLRRRAVEHDLKAVESFERCDTDGALSQWAHGLNAAKDRLEADIADNGGMWKFPALFDLDGNLVAAKDVQTKFGWSWMLLDADGRPSGWFNPSKAENPDTARRNNAKKGYYVGAVLAPAYADLQGGSITSVTPVVIRKDGGYSADVTVVDNGLGSPAAEEQQEPPAAPALTVTREVRGTARWVHITGPAALESKAPAKAGAEARKWARELGATRAYRVSGGGDYRDGEFRYSVCYGFEGAPDPQDTPQRLPQGPAAPVEEQQAPDAPHGLETAPDGNGLRCSCGYADADGMADHLRAAGVLPEPVPMSDLWEIAGRGERVLLVAADSQAQAWELAAAQGVGRDYHHSATRLTAEQAEKVREEQQEGAPLTTEIASINYGRAVHPYDLLDDVMDDTGLNRADAHAAIHAMLDDIIGIDGEDAVILGRRTIRPESLISNPRDLDVYYWLTISDETAQMIRETVAATNPR